MLNSPSNHGSIYTCLRDGTYLGFMFKLGMGEASNQRFGYRPAASTWFRLVVYYPLVVCYIAIENCHL